MTFPLARPGRWFALAALFLPLMLPAARADQFDTLRLTWQTNLFNGAGSASSVASTANSDWSSLNTNNTSYLWSDLPLGSTSANIVSTYDRLQDMALAWSLPGSSLKGNAGLSTAVINGLNWMNSHVYTTSATEYDNWFHWEISGPESLEDTMVLVYPALTGIEITNYLNAVARYSPGGPGATFGWMTGANTSDKVTVMLLRGILIKDSGLMLNAQTNLSPVFQYVTSSDGFYADGSFVFHGNIAYNGHYGAVLFGDIPTIVNLLQGSTWQITDPNLANIYAWATNSFEPFFYHGSMMDMVRGRIISWSYETASSDGSGVLSAMQSITKFAPASVTTQLNNFISSPQLPPGQYNFPDNDRVVAFRNGFGFGLSMSSSRIANYESINGGNLHGWFTGDGMTYLYLGSSETQFASDFWPTVDPYHLPGTTAEQNSHANGAGEAQTTSQNWVGGAQVAHTYGVAGMSLASWNTSLTGRKAWFMFDNEIVCLGAGITCGGPSEVDTTVEDRRLGTSPTANFWVNGNKIPPTMGWSSNLTSAAYCALDGVGGYYFPGGATNLQASFVANTGTWVAINNVDSSTSFTDDYLKLYYNAGIMPVNASYAYVLLPNFTETSVSNYAANPDIIVLTNTINVQAVRKPLIGVVAANFWTNGTSTADLITVNGKCSVITLETSNSLSVGLADPTQTNKGSIMLTLNRAASSVQSADAGVTVVQLSPQVILSINVNGSLGKTFQTVLNYSNSPLPALAGVYPGGGPFQSTNTVAFMVTAAAGVTTNNVVVVLNGVTLTNLIFNGSSTNWNVSYPHLLPNTLYSLAITVTDTNGNVATANNAFDTFSLDNYTWEAEDFDYNIGHYVDGPQTNAYSAQPASVNVDTHQVNFGGKFLYRPNGMDTEVNGDVLRPKYQGTGYSDYSIGFFSAGSWVNYTHHYPAGAYYIYGRFAAGGGATVCTLAREVGGWGTTTPVTNVLGTFNVPNIGWESYNYIPLVNATGQMVAVTFNGNTNTLQLIRPANATADCNANYFMLVPVFQIYPGLAGTNLSLSFPAQRGFNFQVQYKTSLADPVWSPLGGSLPGNDAMQSMNDPQSAGTRFYRVQIQ